MLMQLEAPVEEWLSSREVVVAFRGAFSQTALVDLGALIRNRVRFSKEGKKIFAVFAELAQNIQRYSADRRCSRDDAEGVGVGDITVVERLEHFEVCAENKILREDRTPLARKLNRIEKMDRDEIVSAYKRQRKVGAEPSTKGAGLGLFEIARRASAPPQFRFKELDSRYASLKLVVRIRKQD